MNRKTYEIDCFWKVYVYFCRIWAAATVLGLWGIGVEALYFGHLLGIYLIVLAALLSFLESVFLINYFIIICTDETSMRCLRVWDGILWLDDWRKGLLYLVLAVPCFVQPHQVWMALISGCMLAVTGVLYVIKTVKTHREQRQRSAAQKPSYDRFDEVPNDEIEDSIINPISSVSVMSSVAEQPEILNV
ncbi:uncharacterized protein LOC135468919 [Liolophura sinensis]|uniref:uncharacterized protein LOC135468919 n=1 Tax=Liolophura sinensis TaxID=3198878 RepID=UPI003159827F